MLDRLFRRRPVTPELVLRTESAASIPAAQPAGEARDAEPTRLRKGDGVLTAPGGELHHIDPRLAGKCALVRKNGALTFHVLTAFQHSPEILSFSRTATIELGEAVPPPTPTDLRTIRQYNVAQSDIQLAGKKGTETRGRFRDLIDAAAAAQVNDVKLDRTLEHAIVRFQKDNYLSDPIGHFETTAEDADLLITSAFNYADSGDPVEQPTADQKFTITSPQKLPPNVQTVRGQIAVREDGRRLDLRIIYKSTAFFAAGLADIGLLEEHLDALYYVQNIGAGLFTITAPTDNGKSTTLNLFSIDMVRAKEGRIDVVGIDDPVEFMAPEICQLALTERVDGVDPFEQKVHTTLRLAPHAIKIGECRTVATANAAIDAANTGRLVMTTQHTTGAFGVPFRYERMGVDRHVAYDHETHVCWMSQRLVPALCPHCRIPVDTLPAGLDRRRLSVINRFRPVLESQPGSFFIRGPGCGHCHRSGSMSGLGRRILAAEVILPDRRICRLLADGKEYEARRLAIVDKRSPTMALHGFRHLRDGLIGVEEYMNAIARADQLADDLDALEERKRSAASVAALLTGAAE